MYKRQVIIAILKDRYKRRIWEGGFALKLAEITLLNSCLVTPASKTTGISHGPGPAEVNSPVVTKDIFLNKPHLLCAWFALSGQPKASNITDVDSADVCFELIHT